jgi:hypothetical protein
LVSQPLSAYAEIKVIINGRQINFEVPPTQIRERTMVPLRGIFEALGAEVRWNSYSRSISANRNSTQVELTVGNERASVNGKTVYLDTPPMMVRERVMVPLRFIAEAFGSDVKWYGASQTIEITDSGNQPVAANPATPSPQAVQITEFSHNASEALNLGETLIFFLRGTPGGIAQVTVPGVARAIRMREDSPGSYTAGYPLSNKNAFSNKIPTATLEVGSTTVRATATNPILIKVPTWGQPSTQNPTWGQAATSGRPVITSPANGANVTAPIYIRGNAVPNMTVVLSIASVTSTGQNAGTVEHRVQSDSRGNFNTSMNPQTNSSQMKHVIRAYQIDSQNRNSATTTIEVYQQ